MREQDRPTQAMSVSRARQQFSQVVNRVCRKETRVVVEKSRIPVAAIMSAEDLEKLRRLEAQERQARQRMQAAFAGKSDDELMEDVARLVEEVRQEGRDRQAARP